MTVEMSKKDLEALAGIQCTREEMAAFFGCHTRTIAERIQEYYHVDFPTFMSIYGGKGKVSLRRKIWQSALKGHWDAQKFLAKNHLGLRDTIDNIQRGPDDGPIQTQAVPASLEQLKAEAEKRGLPTTIFEK